MFSYFREKFKLRKLERQYNIEKKKSDLYWEKPNSKDASLRMTIDRYNVDAILFEVNDLKFRILSSKAIRLKEPLNLTDDVKWLEDPLYDGEFYPKRAPDSNYLTALENRIIESQRKRREHILRIIGIVIAFLTVLITFITAINKL